PGASTIQAATNKSESFVDFVKWSSGQVVVRVRHYREFSIQAGGVLTAHGWDGGTGGIVVYRASGSTTVAGTITVAGSDGGVARAGVPPSAAAADSRSAARLSHYCFRVAAAAERART